jgi:hypothetical protein
MKTGLALTLLLAAAAARADTGTTAAPFLQIGVGARGLAMGSAMAAVSDDAYSVYWNPAGLAYGQGHEIAATYASLFQDENQGFLAITGPVSGGLGRWAVAADYVWISNIQARAGDTQAPDSTFNDQNWAVSASYANTFGDRYAFGVTLKGIQETFASFKANSTAVDLGLRAGRPSDPLAFGLTLQNLGFEMSGDPLPVLLKGGIGWKPLSGLTLAADLDEWVNDARTYGDFGAEYRLVPMLALRGGYQVGRSQDQLGGATGLTVGLGLNSSSLSLDYAFLPFGDLGNTHRVSLGYRF